MEAKMRKTFLDIPLEIYFNICSHLEQKDMVSLASVSRGSYVAVQQTLYYDITINTFLRLKSLIRALKSPAAVLLTNIEGVQLRKREVRHLHIVLDKATTREKLQGLEFARLIKEVSRHNENVAINLSLYGAWYSFLAQLCRCEVPNVKRLVVCTGDRGEVSIPTDEFVHFGIWDVCFAGASFPGLEEVEIDNLFGDPNQRPDTLIAASLRSIYHPRSHNIPTRTAPTSLYGLKTIKKIKLRYSWITSPMLQRFFEDEYIAPTNVTHFDISNCANLHPVRDLTTLAQLLRRSLPVVQSFKLHTQRNQTHGKEWNMIYGKYVNKHPEWHLCSIVCELGRNVKSLDLACPYLCFSIFPTATQESPSMRLEQVCCFPREPYDSLSDRLNKAGYRHRRIICWQDSCSGTPEWNNMLDIADNQGDLTSWELINWQSNSASWHVSGYQRMEYTAHDVVSRSLPLTQR